MSAVLARIFPGIGDLVAVVTFAAIGVAVWIAHREHQRDQAMLDEPWTAPGVPVADYEARKDHAMSVVEYGYNTSPLHRPDVQAHFRQSIDQQAEQLLTDNGIVLPASLDFYDQADDEPSGNADVDRRLILDRLGMTEDEQIHGFRKNRQSLSGFGDRYRMRAERIEIDAPKQ